MRVELTDGFQIAENSGTSEQAAEPASDPVVEVVPDEKPVSHFSARLGSRRIEAQPKEL